MPAIAAQPLLAAPPPQQQRGHRCCRQRVRAAMAAPAAGPRRRYHDTAAALAGVPAAPAPGALGELVDWCSSRRAQLRSSPAPYTGLAGLALALWRAGCLAGEPGWRSLGEGLARDALAEARRWPPRRPTESLLDGLAGTLVVAALAGAGGAPALPGLLAEYRQVAAAAAGPDTQSDEVLYGRAGTLLGALLLRRKLGDDAVPGDAVAALVAAILASGRALAARAPAFAAAGCPLAFTWGRHATPYLGAAHGLMGILYALLRARPWWAGDAAAERDVAASLSFVLSCECDAPGAVPGSGGHYPSAAPLPAGGAARHEPLVHWCHGAPGAVYLFATAWEVLREPAHLAAALRAGEAVWARGLLRKGPGLCHGVAGNAYALARLWQATGDALWLDRCRRFAAFMVCSPAGRADWATPDHPASLYEGAAGGVYLLAELAALDAAAAADGAAALAGGLTAADAKTLALAIAVPLLGGVGGSVATMSEVKGWYTTIRKPSWTPPNWLFGPVWTALYTMMGLASWLVWRHGGLEAQALPLAAYAVQLALNLAWTPLFFKAHALGAASADIAALWAGIVGTARLFAPVIGRGATLALLGPYLAWVSYASALTFWIWRHNAPRRAAKAD
ncbi:LanC-like protein 3 [Scenedesmus sp. PABB004]|nr:LanC-like protein 3 [Scenedesmus sp. PABB004]